MSENSPKPPDAESPQTPKPQDEDPERTRMIRPPRVRPAGSTAPSQRPGYVPARKPITETEDRRRKTEDKPASAKREEKTIDDRRQTIEPRQPEAKRETPVNTQPRTGNGQSSAVNRPSSTPSRPASAVPRPSSYTRVWRTRSRLARTFFLVSLAFFTLFFGAIAIGAAAYMSISSELPDPKTLAERQSQFASTKIYDRNNNLILELTDPNDPTAGRRTRVKMSQISDYVKQATIATEDPNFYKYNVGFDPIAIARAFYYAYTEREFVSGGSTITQQVARNLLLTAQERTQRTFSRKLREIVLANALVGPNSPYTRDDVLEVYLNEINYGNLAYGIEAASQTYFNKPAKDLTLAEASLLAGIPQLPTRWDPVANKKDLIQNRQRIVLEQMVQAGFITPSQIQPAMNEMLAREFKPPATNFSTIAPHFMTYVKQTLGERGLDSSLYRGEGLRIYTTLDQNIQTMAEQVIKEQVGKLADLHVTNGSAVVMDPRTGEILAMVGSADFNNTAIDGQVNVALMQRQPGSSIKPFTYLAAMQKGWSPSTLYWDMPKTFTNQYGQTYTPRNYDGKFHGPMLMREALARSMNIPAVETLQFVGVPEFLAFTQKFGINFPPNDQYGLAITLGGAEARLLDMTGAYAVIANNGVRVPPTAIRKVESASGGFSCDYLQFGTQASAASVQATPDAALSCQQTVPQQVIAPEYAYLMTSILSDNNARIKSFGANSVLKLTRPAAVKTGTTNDYRDNLTLGYTPELVVGVWVGNSDNSEMEGVSGITGAAPIWHDIMEKALEGKPASNFTRPPGIIDAEVCATTGRAPSPQCPPDKRIREVFKSDQGPLPADELIEHQVEVGDPNATLQPTPPPQSSEVIISEPANGSVMGRGPVSIRGIANAPGFQQYVVEYGEGDNPTEWKWISGPHLSPINNDQLTTWSSDSLPAGRYTIRVTVKTDSGDIVGYTRFDVGP